MPTHSTRTTQPTSFAVAEGIAAALRFAAAPVFAAMAVLTGAAEAGPSHLICSTAHGASWLSGMPAMYLLMSVFHCAPWLTLAAARLDPARFRPNRRRKNV